MPPNRLTSILSAAFLATACVSPRLAQVGDTRAQTSVALAGESSKPDPAPKKPEDWDKTHFTFNGPSDQGTAHDEAVRETARRMGLSPEIVDEAFDVAASFNDDTGSTTVSLRYKGKGGARDAGAANDSFDGSEKKNKPDEGNAVILYNQLTNDMARYFMSLVLPNVQKRYPSLTGRMTITIVIGADGSAQKIVIKIGETDVTNQALLFRGYIEGLIERMGKDGMVLPPGEYLMDKYLMSSGG